MSRWGNGATALLLAVAVLALTSCDWFASGREEVQLDGRTMGTTYTVRAIGLDDGIDADALRQRVEERLAAVNAALSTWIADSEISRFNASDSTDWVTVSADVHTVVRAAQNIAAKSGGAFDITVAPLVRLWGFGPGKPRPEPPTPDEIAAVKLRVGFDKLAIDPDRPRLRKRDGRLTLDVSAIAKGFGVDAVAAVVEAAGARDYLVEIGGELRVRGINAAGDPWRVAVERPDAAGRSVARVLPLSAGAVATSGDYRNYYEQEGKRLSHLIDPAAGAPISHRVASVTVLADDAMTADGWATALMVLGEEKGPVVARAEGLAALFLVRRGDGFEFVTTPAFDARFGTATADGG